MTPKDSYICLTDLSVFPNPPGDHLMGILKVYLDNSGEEGDPQHKICSLAGYITTVKKWRKFEKLWKQTLVRYKVPYLHMKEFAHYKKPFDIFWDEKLKQEKPERKAFIQSLIDVMEETNLKGIMAVVRLADLKRFNDERGLKIDALAFNLYILMGMVSLTYPKKPIEFIIDRANKPGQMMDKAREYADTDIYLAGCTDSIHLSVLPKGITFKEVTPIQTADFLAWEIRKLMDSRDEWYTEFKTGDDPKIWNQSVKKWSKDRSLTIRESYKVLSKQTSPYGFIWDYDGLCGVDRTRNNIWP
jgi:hypothetical protein